MQLCKKITGVGLKGHDATGDTTVCSFTFQKGEHGLMASVNTIKIANGQGALRRKLVGALGVLKSAKYLHVEPVKFLKSLQGIL
jgi:hypothetical protein